MGLDYVYAARLDRAVDGDTVDLWVDLGFTVWTKSRFRLFGVDTPELRGEKEESERARAVEAKNFTETQLTLAEEILVRSTKRGKYGRYIGDITYRIDGEWYNLSKALLDENLAEPYE